MLSFSYICWANEADTLQTFFPEGKQGYLSIGYNHYTIESNRYAGTDIHKHNGDHISLGYFYGLSDTSTLRAVVEYTFLGAGYDKKFVSQTNTVYLSALLGMHSDITSTYTEDWFTPNPKVTTRKAPASLGVSLKAGLNKRLGSFKVGGSVELKYREEELEFSSSAPVGVRGRYTNFNAKKPFVSAYVEYDNEYRPNIAYRIIPSYSYLNPNFKNAEAYSAFVCEIQGFSGSARLYANDSNTLEVIPEISYLRSSGKDCSPTHAAFAGTLMSLSFRMPL